MTNSLSNSDTDTNLVSKSWFERPLSQFWCVIGWIVAAIIFVVLVQSLGGPAGGDAFESDFSTWGVSHGQFACMYARVPPVQHVTFDYAAPVYPLLTGGVAAVAQIGHGTPFPTAAALGHQCNLGLPAMARWSVKSGAVLPTLRLGYMGWFVLMAGLIALLRVAGRGRRGWEPTTLALVAILPPVWMCIEEYFHPQDLMALGLGLLAVACALRDRWIWAGILVALAVLTQQYALLIAIPLLVVAPWPRKPPFVGGAVLAVIAVVIPVMILTSGKAARFVFLGTGDASGQGGTVVWELHLHGAPLVLLSRVLPLLLAFLFAALVVRRVGRNALKPIVLVSLVAASLSLRLVFEQNIFGYYYMALAVALLIVDVLGGRIRETLIAWYALILLAMGESTISIVIWRQSWNQDARHWIPAIIIIGSLLWIVRCVLRHKLSWTLAVWGGVVVAALLVWPVSSDPLRHQPVTWLWEVILVGYGVALAAQSLSKAIRESPQVDERVVPSFESVSSLPSK